MNTEMASNTRTTVRLAGIPLRCGAEEAGMTSWHHLLQPTGLLQIILRASRLLADADLNLDVGAFGEIQRVFEEQIPVLVAREGPQRGLFCGGLGGCGCGSRTRGFVESLVHQLIRLAILLAVDVVDSEELESLRHFSGAFVERPQVSAFDFVLSAHLLDEQLRIAFDAQGADAMRLGIVERGD